MDLSSTYPGHKTNPSLFGFDERSREIGGHAAFSSQRKEEFVTKSNLELFSFHLTKHSHYEDIQLIAKQNPQLRTQVELSILCLKTIATLQCLSKKIISLVNQKNRSGSAVSVIKISNLRKKNG